MLPINLEWRRPLDGVTIDRDEGERELSRVRGVSDRTGPRSYRITALDKPVAVDFANINSEERTLAFIATYGFPDATGGKLIDRYDAPSNPLPEAETSLIAVSALRERIRALLETTRMPDPAKRAAALNSLSNPPVLFPHFEYSTDDGRHRLSLRPFSLEDLMVLECAVAIDEGAVLTNCAHCLKGFLVGPLTGRRTHATYCSDRCRVAAMRARNALKGE